MLYPKKPKTFPNELKVAACIIEHEGKVLLLQQAEHKNSPGSWLEPGGKIEPGETPEQTMIREIYEETGIEIQTGKAKELFTKYFYFLETNISIVFYHYTTTQKPEVTISDEHSDFVWISPAKALRLNLVEDFAEILEEIYSIT